MAVSVKEAVAKALQYMHDLYGSNFSDFLLEELEPTEDGKFWLITIGFSRPVPSSSTLAELIRPKGERFYKIVKVDTTTGEPISIKIRPI